MSLSRLPDAPIIRAVSAIPTMDLAGKLETPVLLMGMTELDSNIQVVHGYLDRLRREIERSVITAANVAWTPGTIASGSTATLSLTVRNAAPQNPAVAAFSLGIPAGAFILAHVTAVDTVLVTLANLSGAPITLGAGTLRVDVLS